MSDLAWTLHNRRSTLPYRSSVVVPAGSGNPQEAARSAILAEIERLTESSHKLHRSSSVAAPKILAVRVLNGLAWVPYFLSHLLGLAARSLSSIAILPSFLLRTRPTSHSSPSCLPSRRLVVSPRPPFRSLSALLFKSFLLISSEIWQAFSSAL
ncbi:hypothetical protein LB505_009272 [Fusarium chuoi]|nr:hypothetical protein LB505_009272 [Fusarium chuoi]